MSEPTRYGKRWQHRVMVSGKRKSGTFDTKAAALKWEAVQRTAPAVIISAQTCADAFKRYELEVSVLKRGARWEALRLNAFSLSSLGPIKMGDISAVHVAAWRNQRLKVVSGSTVNREMNLLSHVFTIARKEWHWVTKSPTTEVSRPKESAPRQRRVTEDEIERICLTLNWKESTPVTKQQTIAAAFLFAIETAMRAGEICSLEAGDVVGRVAHLRRTKNGDARDVPLSPRALQIWALVPDGFDITTASLDTMFRTARERASIEGMTFHDTRHEAITRLAKKLHVLDLARMTGHRDVKKLMIYYNLSAEDIADKL